MAAKLMNALFMAPSAEWIFYVFSIIKKSKKKTCVTIQLKYRQHTIHEQIV